MYQYRSKRPSRNRRGKTYILPFIIIALLVGIVWATWSLIDRVWLDGNRNTSAREVQLRIDSGSVKVMTATQGSWENVATNLGLYPGEKVRVGVDGQASLFFSSDMELRLDRSAEVELVTFEQKEDRYDAVVQVEEGLTWASLGNLALNHSNFELRTEFLRVNGSSAQFAVQAPGTVYMIAGQGSVEIMEGNKPVKSVTLGVGQQLSVDQAQLEKIKRGDQNGLIVALSDDFKTSPFYLWNARQGGLSTAQNENNLENGDIDSVAGLSEAVASSTENTSTQEDASTESSSADQEDAVVTGKVEIISPSKEATHESTTFNFDLNANVPSHTAKVVINGNYTLNQYKAGDTVAKYYVRQSTGNVKEGSNTYTVVAYDKNDNKIGEDSIVVKVTAKAEETSTEEPSSNPSSGTVRITSPSSEPTYESSTTEFQVRATVSTSTAKVNVNGYTLGQYTAGATTATYNVKKSNANVKEGENTYTFIAYDKDGATIGSDSITITVKTQSDPEANSDSSTNNDPAEGNTEDPAPGELTFNYPASSGTYSTSLSPINIGGSIPKNMRNLYLNDNPLDSHALGNTSWSFTLELKPGENVFKIYAEDEQYNSTAVKTLIIDYQGN